MSSWTTHKLDSEGEGEGDVHCLLDYLHGQAALIIDGFLELRGLVLEGVVLPLDDLDERAGAHLELEQTARVEMGPRGRGHAT